VLWWIFPWLQTTFGENAWRGVFIIGVIPALLILYIRTQVPESPAWEAGSGVRVALQRDLLVEALRRFWPLFIFAMFFMASFNFMSHGSQDLYATLLRTQKGQTPALAGQIGIIASFGAILGGICFGWLSQRFGRRWMIIAAAVLGVLFIKLWTGPTTYGALALGGFLMQFAVQGAWGIIPAHLNELSPSLARGTFPGFTYQLGNLIASPTAQIIAVWATVNFGTKDAPNYADAMSLFMYCAFGAVILFTLLGFLVKPENREVNFVEVAVTEAH
jgi:MFS transporter, SHS family, lactate transporter